MAQAVILEWVLPEGATGVTAALVGPPGSTEQATEAALAAIRAGVDEDLDDLSKIANALVTADGLRGAPGGVATLDDDGLVPVDQLPPTATTATFVVTSQAEMLALAAQRGDVVIRSDLSRSFVLGGPSAATLADWKELLSPVPPVTSVNGKAGAVALTAGEVGAQPVDPDLSALAGMAHAPGDLIQDVGGEWTNRTLTQVLAGGATVGAQITTPIGPPGTSGYGFAGSTSSFYANGANSLGLAIAGSERVRVDGGYLASANPIGLGAAASVPDVLLCRDGANSLALRNSNNSQRVNIYEEYISSSNFNRGSFYFSGNNFVVGTEAQGGGVSAAIAFAPGGTTKWSIAAGGDLVPVIDNSVDIGNEFNRPKSGYFGSCLSVGGVAPAGVAASSSIQCFGRNWSLVGGNNVSDSANKDMRIGSAHYSNYEEPLIIIAGTSTVSSGVIAIGGGDSAGNAATQISFYTAVNATTASGTLRWSINASGHLLSGVDNNYDFGANGFGRPRNGYFGGFITIGSSITLGSTSPIVFGSRSTIASPVDGQLTLSNSNTTDFDRLNFGGLTSAFPALKRVGSILQSRLADDSGRAGLEASTLGLTSDLSLAASGKFNWSGDLYLARDAANTLGVRNGLNSQSLRVYQTYTDPANGAWLDVGWNSSNNGWTIGASKNGSGAYAYLYINIQGTPRWYFGSGSTEFSPNADNNADIGTAGSRVRNLYVYKILGGSTAGNIDLTGTAVRLDVGGNTNNPDNFQFANRTWGGAMTTAGRWIGSQVNIAPTSGGATQQSHFSLRSTINQTGAHTGDIVVYHADVSLTAAIGATYFAQFNLAGAAKFSVTTAGRVTAADGVVTTPTTFSGLPASPADGQRAFVTDSNLAAAGNFGLAAGGGGTSHVPVYFDGGAAAWKIG